MQLFSGMTNSVDHDQTMIRLLLQEQKQSDLDLDCLHMPFYKKLLCMKFYHTYFRNLFFAFLQKMCYTWQVDVFEICQALHYCTFSET